jgi:hypothetical protein
VLVCDRQTADSVHQHVNSKCMSNGMGLWPRPAALVCRHSSCPDQPMRPARRLPIPLQGRQVVKAADAMRKRLHCARCTSSPSFFRVNSLLLGPAHVTNLRQKKVQADCCSPASPCGKCSAGDYPGSRTMATCRSSSNQAAGVNSSTAPAANCCQQVGATARRHLLSVRTNEAMPAL